MKTSIATVSVSGTLREKLAAIAAAGFDGIEIFEQDFIANDASPREVGRMVRDHGLEIMLFQPFRDFETLPEPLRSRAFARAERKFDLMAELGCDTVLFCSSSHPQSLGGIDRAADDFAALGDIAGPRGIRVGFEALCWGRHIDDHRDAWEVVRRANHPNIGLILDSFHTLGRKIDPDTIRRIPGDRIFFVQLADAPAIEMDLLYWSRHFRNMPGEGDLDVTRFMRAVAATGYDGPLSLEIFNDQFRAGLPRLVATDGHRSLVNLMDAVRRAEPALDVVLPAFPPPSRVEEVAFVEFVAGRDKGEDGLETLLASAGFAPCGQHRTKDVTLWRQGAVNLIVNRDFDGFARTLYVGHGTTVGEVGLKMPNAEAAFLRATALDAKPHDTPVPPSELAIPAVQGVGGSLIRFLDDGPRLGSVWDSEFAATPAPAGTGIVGIDHLGQTMPYDEMLSWALFYTAILDGRKSSMVDVIDPNGLVRSQAIRSGGLRVTLNGTESRRTLAGRFVEDTFGSSVQHIAFATADILATAAMLAERGFPVLPIGANYYDDLETRFALDPAFTARLAAANIMYDEDDSGAFLQLYSLPRSEGLFLEIVERRGGYDGYGAPNAPYRIAALQRAMRDPGIPRR